MSLVSMVEEHGEMLGDAQKPLVLSCSGSGVCKVCMHACVLNLRGHSLGSIHLVLEHRASHWPRAQQVVWALGSQQAPVIHSLASVSGLQVFFICSLDSGGQTQVLCLQGMYFMTKLCNFAVFLNFYSFYCCYYCYYYYRQSLLYQVCLWCFVILYRSSHL